MKDGDFHSHEGTPIAGWFSNHGNPMKKWMMTTGVAPWPWNPSMKTTRHVVSMVDPQPGSGSLSNG